MRNSHIPELGALSADIHWLRITCHIITRCQMRHISPVVMSFAPFLKPVDL